MANHWLIDLDTHVARKLDRFVAEMCIFLSCIVHRFASVLGR